MPINIVLALVVAFVAVAMAYAAFRAIRVGGPAGITMGIVAGVLFVAATTSAIWLSLAPAIQPGA